MYIHVSLSLKWCIACICKWQWFHFCQNTCITSCFWCQTAPYVGNVLMLRCVVLAWHSTHSCWLNDVHLSLIHAQLYLFISSILSDALHFGLIKILLQYVVILFEEFCWPCTVDFWQERALLKQTKTSLRAVMQSLIPIKWFHLTSCG